MQLLGTLGSCQVSVFRWEQSLYILFVFMVTGIKPHGVVGRWGSHIRVAEESLAQTKTLSLQLFCVAEMKAEQARQVWICAGLEAQDVLSNSLLGREVRSDTRVTVWQRGWEERIKGLWREEKILNCDLRKQRVNSQGDIVWLSGDMKDVPQICEHKRDMRIVSAAVAPLPC